MSMTIEQVQDERRLMERAIRDAVSQFEGRTKVIVDSIELQRVHTLGAEIPMLFMNVTTTLRLP